MELIVYGDFNCPYSRLASLRVDRLISEGIADVEWRAVQHDTDIPDDGVPVEGDLKAELEREIDEIGGLLRGDEDARLELPSIRPGTSSASAAFAAQPSDRADEWRRRAFDGIWTGGEDLRSIVEASARDDAAAAAWQKGWMSFERRVVPLLVLPDGTLSRGLGALKRLADLLDG